MYLSRAEKLEQNANLTRSIRILQGESIKAVAESCGMTQMKVKTRFEKTMLWAYRMCIGKSCVRKDTYKSPVEKRSPSVTSAREYAPYWITLFKNNFEKV